MALPLGLIAVVTVVDILAPPHVHLGPLLVAAPAVTAAIGGPRLVVLVGAVATAAQLAIGVTRRGWLTVNHQMQLLALVVVTAVIAVFVTLRERQQREMTQVRSVSEAVQRVLLRPLPPSLGPLRVASVYLAADAEAQVGGDLFAAARTGGQTRVIIGDVRGKGLSSVSDAALLLGAFREAAHQHAELSPLTRYLERSVSRDLAELAEADRASEEDFITAAVVEIPDDRAVVRLVNCGHPPPLLVRGRDVTPLRTDQPETPLGLGDLAPSDYRTDTFPLGDNDLLLLYTDGVVEARDAAGVFYPLVERLTAWAGDDAETLVRRLKHDLLAHSGGSLGDDAAIVALQRTPRQGRNPAT
ncbi:PP2C family protein-serine/threonine phosphatase [Streptomyces spirodelae]|uniref:PP2C family protein-serine/threonine phosphatase n=1 Tax=Streptomyces spirodelae TaxID=2812904 RepID=UPI001E49897C|nr:PP2C family protein-serine/threonine phosphatase [Streptomyces spirodelae]